ncbi:leucine-rich repeat-containing protein let-4-like [Sabethes cyaneus]|uniref:leucine-rich repeat-containing protein let-4-like n=1 Tax=Sabethes cyaneus TaxID=53552 RepID=UPI00237E34B0|nr:leucine-rich repeat-containing protein let-4-like [Sabethes cyaneus]
MCILDNVNYSQHNSKAHIFPKGYPHVRIINNGWLVQKQSRVEVLDAELYNNFDRPEALELVDVDLQMLEIPRSLKLANLGFNHINQFSIEKAEGDPLLTYLDVTRNSITDLINVTSLVNLETLYLVDNQIEIITRYALKGLKKLKILNLEGNNIVRVSMEEFPRSLSFLKLFNNEIKELNYEQMTLPELETLNLEHNYLQTINTRALLQAMPKLTTFYIGGNLISHGELSETITLLDRHNISYKNENDPFGCNQENYAEEICMQKHSYIDRGWLTVIGLTVLVLLVGTVFVCIVWRVYIAMNK